MRKKNFRRIRYVYIEKNPEDPETVSATVKEVYDKATAGADFNSLIDEYGEDPDMDRLMKDGYYYTLGAIDEAVQEAVEKLDEGAIAPVIEVSYGYYVVQRLALDETYVNKNYEIFRAQYRARVFNEMLAAEAEKVKITYEKLYDELTVTAVS
jgi:parvulin-like peptidyl-prolyl isomerase